MNRADVIAVATGIVEYNHSTLLYTYGGPVVLGKKYTNSILGGNGSGEAKSYTSCKKASWSGPVVNCDQTRQCPSLSQSASGP